MASPVERARHRDSPKNPRHHRTRFPASGYDRGIVSLPKMDLNEYTAACQGNPVYGWTNERTTETNGLFSWYDLPRVVAHVCDGKHRRPLANSPDSSSFGRAAA